VVGKGAHAEDRKTRLIFRETFRNKRGAGIHDWPAARSPLGETITNVSKKKLALERKKKPGTDGNKGKKEGKG